MLQYLRCIEKRGVHDVGVRFRIFRNHVVQETKPFPVNNRTTCVCGKRFLDGKTFSMRHASCSLLVAHVQPQAHARELKPVSPPTSQSGFNDLSSVLSLHSLLKHGIKRFVDFRLVFAEFSEGPQRHPPAFGFLAKDVPSVQAVPAKT